MSNAERRTSMRDQLLYGLRRFAFLAAVGGVVSGLGACRGDLGSGDEILLARTYAYITVTDSQDAQAPGAVYQFTINADGSLTALSMASVPAGSDPTSVVSDPSGHHVYVTNLGDATISQYAVGQDGGLTPLSPAVVSISGPFPFAAGYSATIDPKDHFLYVVLTPRDPPVPTAAIAAIAQYAIGTDGKLTPLSTPYVQVNAAAHGYLAIDASGQHAYLAGSTGAGGDQVFQFSVGTDGALSPLTPASVAAAGTTIGVLVAPNGQTAYVLSTCIDTECNGQVAQYTVGADGELTSTGVSTLTGSHVIPVAMLTNGSAAYLLTNLMGVDTNTGAVHQYDIGTTGELVPDTPPSVMVKSGSVAESIHGSSLYALSSNAVGFASGSPSGGNLDQYAIDPGGLLMAVATVPLDGGSPTGMTILAPH